MTADVVAHSPSPDCWSLVAARVLARSPSPECWSLVAAQALARSPSPDCWSSQARQRWMWCLCTASGGAPLRPGCTWRRLLHALAGCTRPMHGPRPGWRRTCRKPGCCRCSTRVSTVLSLPAVADLERRADLQCFQLLGRMGHARESCSHSGVVRSASSPDCTASSTSGRQQAPSSQSLVSAGKDCHQVMCAVGSTPRLPVPRLCASWPLKDLQGSPCTIHSEASCGMQRLPRAGRAKACPCGARWAN